VNKIQVLEAEVARLRAENEHLKADLRRRDAEAQAAATLLAPVQLRLPLGQTEDAPVTKRSPLAERIAFFRSLFRGRPDVYARRWENADGRSGYAPAAPSAEHRKQKIYLPLTDAVIEQHLGGAVTAGVYPLLRDNTCWFLAADFDQEGWQADAAAYLTACQQCDVPAALERSRSGNGGHVWIFFAEPVPAGRARRLGESLLTRAMELRPELGLESYDRLFPNQDTLPRGGVGNLIALPLQPGPGRRGNSLFVDPATFAPFADQWVFLSGVLRLPSRQLETLVRAAERAHAVLAVRESLAGADSGEDPWILPPSGQIRRKLVPGPFPASVRVTLGNLLYVDRAGLPPALLNRIWRLAAFPNPEFHRRQALRFSTFDTPRVVHCAETFDRQIGLPRGLLDDVTELLTAHGIAVDLADERNPGQPLDVTFQGELTPVQRRAADAVLAGDCGVLSAPTAFGKTVISAWLIAARRVNTLIIVHRQVLVDQWRAHLAAFLDLSPRAIGQRGAGRKKTTGRVDIALFQSLSRQGAVADLVAEYGQVIVDECHHVPAKAFEPVLRAAKARFVLGLTATPIRRDGQHPIIVMQCGPVRFRLDPKDEGAARPFQQVVVPRPTAFQLPPGAETSGIQGVYAALAADEARNALIYADVLHLLAEGRTPLLLTERLDHLEVLAARLREAVPHVVIFRGGTGPRRRWAASELLAAVPDGEACVLLATGRYIGEGFDESRPDTLLLTMPVSWRGTVWQYAGRISRPRPGKNEVRIYDYADLGIPMLASMHRKRLRAYRVVGYVIQSPPSPSHGVAAADPPVYASGTHS
jgi:superfamily II DNA or RNA helicase